MTHPTATLDEVWALFKETDRKFQETAREMRQLSQETDRKFKETGRMIKELRTEIGNLGNRLGDFVEGLIKPSVVKLFQQRGIAVDRVYRDMEANNQELGLATQIDLFVVDHNICVLIEVKSCLSIDDVNDHLERMEKFKPLFPEYQNKQAHGAVAGMVIPDDVAK
jgi:hypothetical protein